MTTARILSIDGGGIRGIIPAIVLQHIENSTGKSIGDLFHMVAGTSTGGVLALGLAKQESIGAADLVAEYRDHGGEIFSRSLWKRFISLGGTVDEKYEAKNLETRLEALLGDDYLSAARCEALVTAYHLEERRPFFFKSWRAQGRYLDKQRKPPERSAERDFLMRDVARATSAAPTYFEPAQIRNAAKECFPLVDGGVFANNPAMCAYASARKIYPKAERIVMVSLGTGYLERPYKYNKAKNWGLFCWARPIFNIIMDGVQETVDYQLHHLLKEDFFRFQIDLRKFESGEKGPNEDIDDARTENIDRLVRKAEALIRIEKTRLEELCAFLIRENPTPREVLGFENPE